LRYKEREKKPHLNSHDKPAFKELVRDIKQTRFEKEYNSSPHCKLLEQVGINQNYNNNAV